MKKLKFLAERKSVIAACLKMNASGINQNTAGNVSRRTKDGMLITASGMPYDTMTPQHVVEMDLEGGYWGDILPSVEWRMHRDIYVNNPDAEAVMHVHSTFASALACLRIEIPAFHYMIGVAGGTTLRTAEYAEYGTAELSVAMLKALKDRRACLLANHGQICFAGSLDKVLALAIEIETLCHQYWAASLMGKPVILSPAEMDAVLRRFPSYGRQLKDADGSITKMLSTYAPARRDTPKKR